MAEKDKDVVLLGPQVTPAGGRAFLRKEGEDSYTAGILGPPGTLGHSNGYLQLEHLNGPAYRVVEEVHFTGSHSRPATKDYRDGWDRVFGGSSSSEELN